MNSIVKQIYLQMILNTRYRITASKALVGCLIHPELDLPWIDWIFIDER